MSKKPEIELHDTIIEKGSVDDKPVSNFTYEELLGFDAGIRKGSVFAETRVPTLDEFFRICSMTGMQPIFSVHPALTSEGFNVSVAAMCGGVSGITMRKLIDLGVSEFTLDFHCSMELDW